MRSRLGMMAVVLLCGALSAAEGESALFKMSLEDLMKEPLSEVGSFTGTSRQDVPAAVTRIDETDIFSSGARDLMELLDIYVPGLQWARHNWEPKHMGLRGIISDREDKYIIRVNGHAMNERTHAGAITERDFPMLDDIETIDIIRGPGSAVYGLGAVSMIIDIKTRTGRTHEGSEVTVRGGTGMDFASISAQTSFEIFRGLDAYLYLAAGKVNGADNDDAPTYYGTEFTNRRNELVEKGEAFNGPQVHDGAQHRDLPPVKMHFQVTGDNVDFWLRYTRAGSKQASPINHAALPPAGSGIADDAVNAYEELSHGYQQLSGGFEIKHDWTRWLKTTTTIAGDQLDWERVIPAEVTNSHMEEEARFRQLFHFTPNEKHSVVLGGEYTYEHFGRRSIGYPNKSASSSRFTGAGYDMGDWETTTLSWLSEWQWRMTDEWSMILGNRSDKNTYSDWLHSPRFSLLFSPNDRNVFKWMVTRSARMGFQEELRVGYLESAKRDADPEQLDALEFRYEHSRETWTAAAGAYYNELDVIGWDSPNTTSTITGVQKHYGLEFELEKRWEKTRLRASHAIFNLLDFELLEGASTYVTAKPYGFGDDLHCWANQVSKLVLDHEFTTRWRGHASLRMNWDWDGYQDWVDYRETTRPPRTEPDFKEAFQMSVFLNLGTSYKLRDNIDCSLNAYNVLGLFDDTLNKRPFLASYGGYRSEAPSVALTVKFSF